MKKLLLILSASLLLPVTASSVYAGDKPKAQKIDQVGLKGLDRFTKPMPKPTGNLSFGSSINVAKAAKADAVAKSQEFKCGLLSSDKWDGEELYGAYAFSTADINKFETLYVNSELQPNAGGFFTEDKYYFTYYTTEDYDAYINTYVVNTNTWTIEQTFDQDGDTYSVAYAMSYDPIEKVAFGSFYDGTDESSYWGYMDLSTGSVMKISSLDNILVAVAINDQGEVYAVDNDGYFLSVSKYTGEINRIQRLTSSVTTDYQQAASISEDGKFYWAVVTTGDGIATGLITIDIATATVEGVEQFTDYEYIGALYCEPASADEGAPANPTNLKLNFVDDSLKGYITFDVPAVDNLGAAISDDVKYIIYIDGEQALTGTTAAGQTATVNVEVAKAGTHTIAVRLANDKGQSSRIIGSQWIGIDRPVAVTNLTLTKDGDSAKLTWTAPTGGAIGGYFDINRVSYTVTRLSDNKVVAEGLKETSFTDDLSSLTEPVYVTYKVVALADDVEGNSATTNGAVFGPAYQVSADKPVTFNLDTVDNFNLFTIINANLNGNRDDGEWQYSPSAGCAGFVSGTEDGDDWFITPDIYLKSDRQYIFSYDMQSYGGTYWPDKYEVYMGAGATAAAMTTQLLAPTVVYWEEYRKVSIVVTVPADGVYNFGFHALTEADGRFCMLDNIEVAESYNLKAPVAVTNLTVVAGDKGASTATVSFDAPTTAIDGSTLTELASVKVYRGADLVKEFTNPAPGATLTFEESDLADGYAYYTVVGATKQGEGVKAEEKAWVGLDAPNSPTAHMAIRDDNPVISWEAPQGRGQHGGYVDVDNLVYAVYNVSSQKVLVEGSTEFTCTDEDFFFDGEGVQELFEYGVYAYNEKGQSEPASTFFINGEKYVIPFVESVAGGTTDQLLLFKSENVSTDSEYYDGWFIDSDNNTEAQDGDKGSFMIMPSTAGLVATIQMGKIDMTQAKDAFLEFYLKRLAYDNDYPETVPDNDTFEVYVGGPDYETTLVKSVKLVDMKGASYVKYTVPLTEYNGKDFIFLQFKLNAPGAYYPVILDNVQVRNTYSVNMQAKSITVPASVDVTKTFNAKVVVRNDAASAVSNYTVQVKAGKKVVAEKTVTDELAADATATVELELTALAEWDAEQTLVATVSVANDECADDDSVETTIVVIRPSINAVADFALAETNTDTQATFKWTAPEIDTVQHVVEDFESYTHGRKTTGQVGEWSFIDGDGSQFLNSDVGDIVNVPGMYGTRAFQVFNQQGTSTVPTWVEDDEEWAPHSGNQMMIALANEYNSNDDWMVSPKLPGKAQTISFWAKGLKGKERLAVYYSTTNNSNVSAFEDNDLDDFRLKTEWTKYTFELPEGTVYFAIQYQGGNNSLAAFVDDVEFDKVATYNVTPVVEGYNLYCDGVKVNEDVITDTTYSVSRTDVSGKYYVTTVYNVGESSASNTVQVTTSGVADLTVDGSEDNAPVYDLYGRRVSNMQPGQVYIRKNQKFVYRK